MPCKQTRYFELVFSFWRTLDSNPTTTYTYIQIDFEAAEELTLDEYERRKETLPLDEVIRQAKEIINPIYMN